MKTVCHLLACIAAVNSPFIAAAQTTAPDFKAPLDASISSGPKGLAIGQGSGFWAGRCAVFTEQRKRKAGLC